MSIYGIDVSHHQGKINWRKVKQDGIEFAILKAMYESSQKPDEYFEANYAGCFDNSIKKGAYIFIGAKSIANPVQDAQAFLKALNGKKLEYGIWIDAEGANVRAIGRDRITKLIDAESAVFKAAGYNKVGIYTNVDWFNHVLDVDYLKTRYPFWVARYPKNDNGNLVSSISPKAYATAWQYSSKGQVNGITGNVDMDVDYSINDWFVHQAALEVIDGKWGTKDTAPTRQVRLNKAGYVYQEVQNEVNRILKARKK